MKIEKLREMTRPELEHKLLELKDSLLKIKVKVQTKQVENTAQVCSARRDIARILTLLREMEQAGVQNTGAVAAEETKTAEAVKKQPVKK